MTVSMRTVRMEKSRPINNNSERWDIHVPQEASRLPYFMLKLMH